MFDACPDWQWAQARVSIQLHSGISPSAPSPCFKENDLCQGDFINNNWIRFLIKTSHYYASLESMLGDNWAMLACQCLNHLIIPNLCQAWVSIGTRCWVEVKQQGLRLIAGTIEFFFLGSSPIGSRAFFFSEYQKTKVGINQNTTLGFLVWEQ